MKKLIACSAVAMLAITTPALAFQCPKLVKQINDIAGNRFDGNAQAARVAADQAAKLHAEGKHAESEKMAKEALERLGVK